MTTTNVSIMCPSLWRVVDDELGNRKHRKWEKAPKLWGRCSHYTVTQCSRNVQHLIFSLVLGFNSGVD